MVPRRDTIMPAMTNSVRESGRRSTQPCGNHHSRSVEPTMRRVFGVMIIARGCPRVFFGRPGPQHDRHRLRTGEGRRCERMRDTGVANDAGCLIRRRLDREIYMRSTPPRPSRRNPSPVLRFAGPRCPLRDATRLSCEPAHGHEEAREAGPLPGSCVREDPNCSGPAKRTF